MIRYAVHIVTQAVSTAAHYTSFPAACKPCHDTSTLLCLAAGDTHRRARPRSGLPLSYHPARRPCSHSSASTHAASSGDRAGSGDASPYRTRRAYRARS